jgi:hypothetical protein
VPLHGGVTVAFGSSAELDRHAMSAVTGAGCAARALPTAPTAPGRP